MKPLTWIILLTSILESCQNKNSFHNSNIPIKSILNFGKSWTNSQRISISVVLPIKRAFNARSVVLIAKEIERYSDQEIFFRFTRNDTQHNKNYTELIWYPFPSYLYHGNCDIFDMLDHNKLLEKFVLIFVNSKIEAVNEYEPCKIRFDSNIAVYYQRQNSNGEREKSNEMQFDEIFKVKENASIKSFMLAHIDLNTTKLTKTGLNTYIWKRRNNLNQMQFIGISEIFGPCITEIQIVANQIGEQIIKPIGFFPDIMQQLMISLNFSIQSAIPEKRNNWTYLVSAISEKRFDIGYAWFTFDLTRRKVVDLSTGIIPGVTGLFYTKGTNDLAYDMYLKPLYPETWISFSLYTALVMVVLISFLLLSQPNRESRNRDVFVLAMKKSLNFTLRSIVGKRITREPSSSYARIAFFVLVFNGFFIITLYRAVFVAFVAIDFDEPPVKSLSDILHSKYDLAIQANTAFDDITKGAEPLGAINELIESGKIKRFYSNTKSYVEKMLTEHHEASKSILLASIQELQFNHNYPCNIGYIKSTPNDAILNVGMIFKKNWPYTKLFNFHLLMMKESGMLDQMLQKYKENLKATCPNEKRISIILKKFVPTGIEKTIFLYIVITGGFLISFIVFISEVYDKYRTK